MIEVRNFSKRYGAVRACENVSFSVNDGSFTVLLGTNGAGKSTVLKALCGVAEPDAGSITVCGHDIAEEPIAAKRRIGCVFEDSPLYGEMTVKEYLAFVAAIFGMDKKKSIAETEKAIELCDLGEWAKRRCMNLSRGTRQRVSLAQALVHDPDVIILDEPASGLDPLQVADFIGILRGFIGKKTIVYSTHIMQEIEESCTDVVIIDRGIILATGSKQELVSATGSTSLGAAFLTTVQKKGGRGNA